MPKVRDLTGTRFGRLVVEKLDRCERGAWWICRCDCGGTSIIRAGNLKGGSVQSCGCLRKKLIGPRSSSAHPLYKIWCAMVRRCEDPKAINYQRYHDKGVTVCERWKSFENFCADVGERPEGHSLDRKDNGKGYEPGNVRWATAKQQADNRSSTHYMTIEGRTMPMMDWCRERGIPQSTVSGRIARGWSAEDAIGVTDARMKFEPSLFPV